MEDVAEPNVILANHLEVKGSAAELNLSAMRSHVNNVRRTLRK